MQHRAVPQPVHTVDRRRIDVGNATLHAQSHGAPDAPAVVLMASLASDVTSWEPQVPLEQGLTSTIQYFRKKMGILG